MFYFFIFCRFSKWPDISCNVSLSINTMLGSQLSRYKANVERMISHITPDDEKILDRKWVTL